MKFHWTPLQQTEGAADNSAQEEQKRRAAAAAALVVEPSMVVGLGVGSTVGYVLPALAKRMRGGELKNVVYVASSAEVAARAAFLGLPVVVLNERPHIDLSIDGADEVDRELRLLKGRSGSPVCEKTLAQASRRRVIVVDHSKLSDWLGQRARLAVEVFPFAWRLEHAYLQELGASPELRIADGGHFLTECGNLVLDCDFRRFGRPTDPAELSASLDARAGIAGHGLFVNLVTEVFVGKDSGVHLIVAQRGDG